MKVLYPRIPITLNLPELKKALAVGLHFLAIGKNPKECYFNGADRIKTKITLSDYAEDCLAQLLKESSFQSQNEIIVFSLQYLKEVSEKRPQILNAKL